MALLLFACGTNDKKNEMKTTQPVQVSIQKITVSEQPEVLTYTGSIKADNVVSMGFGVTGRVVSVNVQ